eukprot:SM000065S20215  [mRNA]  locus=s65:288301:292052:- [translate_table: standard]
MGATPEDHRALQQLKLSFKLQGLEMVMDAVRAVSQFTRDYGYKEEEAVKLVVSALCKRNLSSNVVRKSVVDEVLAQLGGAALHQDKDHLMVIDAFEMPRNRYDPVRKVFFRDTGARSLHSDASSKTELYRERLALLQQRLLRNKLFTRPALLLKGSETEYCELTPIQSLVGCTGRKYVMGAISQLEDGRFFLEDNNASVPHSEFSMALTKRIHLTTTGLFTENSMVVIEGELQPEGVFKAKAMGYPPVKHRDDMKVTDGLDFFGAGPLKADEERQLLELEKAAMNDMFVVLSDVWLDNEESMRRLETVLAGYESVEVVPSLFIFIGDFCSKPCNLAFSDFSLLKSQFSKLGATISSHSRIRASSRFIFVPGPGDPGPAHVLPRPALPNYFASAVREHIPDAVFGSNPCRIKYYSQEIVVFRYDLLQRMRRACVIPPSNSETKEPFHHLVATVLQQGHLCPLPLSTQPVFWDFDHALRLYPAPHTLVLADRAGQQQFTCDGIVTFNPGSFANDGTFVAYRPATRQPELSQVS